MSDRTLNNLLEKLSCGDDNAIAEAFQACEPYLRMVVRRRLSADLRAKFDSIDIVQSVWAHAITGFRRAGWRFNDAAHLRAFLVRLTQNRLIDRFRSVRTSLERERPIEEAFELVAPNPEPSQRLDADELWERLVALCPPEHLEVLRHKREGASASEIAEMTGLHEGSVRRILGALAGRLARAGRGEAEVELERLV